MFGIPYSRSILHCSKRLKLSIPIRPLTTTSVRSEEIHTPNSDIIKEIEAPDLTPEQLALVQNPDADPAAKEWMERLESIHSKFRLPRSVQALHFQPLKRTAKYGLPVCNLQLRAYSSRQVDLFSDFALRAAYFLNLPATGPVPLPRIVERWTVLRGPFIHSKKPENFERITLRRLIQIKDGHVDGVQAWLAFLRKNSFYGVGMKANVWEYASLDVGKEMEKTGEEVLKALGSQLANFGARKGSSFPDSMQDILDKEKFTRNHAPLSEVRKFGPSPQSMRLPEGPKRSRRGKSD
ncbi:mitochondrial 37S ribosomal protein rsm10 [Ophidiomyces ophidiicola]|nr:mitochondrial 37S ribosomal protein rsm10 [Ophidiomyces ophidiicola]KAI1916562.1 mitochondrial 37S ribosomal protein rsm10 [Ophidiomyces ophidiicola]KAI1972555.1 mitochondrial 37S ribosomal protein rsm10 [Ophidiomyces ophidiicola]KAI1983668.1 mitochondrial 37S ribosomal protein rsm10 [Ophidiomyces ophidiicola]KAI1989716.1 mitochondrial 37S ribosomal protein rsm10 [Ophidiomyces ophidiicola]